MSHISHGRHLLIVKIFAFSEVSLEPCFPSVIRQEEIFPVCDGKIILSHER